MRIRFKYRFASFFLGFILLGCSELSQVNEKQHDDAALKTANDYEEAFFHLAPKMEILDKSKVKCVVSIDTSTLFDDIGEVALARLQYLFVRDVSIPVSSTDVQENLYIWYIASYGECEEALALTTNLIKAENPTIFPTVKIEGPEALDFLTIIYTDK